MKLAVHNSTGTDTPGVVYLNGSARSDFGDLRFTKSDGVTLLDYWIESYTSGVSAVVWVEVDSIPASSNTIDIYIYYGNPSAARAINGAATFAAFDDFSTNQLGSYWSGDTGYFYVSNNKLISTAVWPGVYRWLYHPLNFGNNDFILHSKTEIGGIHTIAGINSNTGNMRENAGNSVYYVDEGSNYRDCNWGRKVNGTETWPAGWQASNGQNNFDIKKAGTTFKWYQNGNLKDTKTIANFDETYVQLQAIGNGSAFGLIYVRKFANPGPVWA